MTTPDEARARAEKVRAWGENPDAIKICPGDIVMDLLSLADQLQIAQEQREIKIESYDVDLINANTSLEKELSEARAEIEKFKGAWVSRIRKFEDLDDELEKVKAERDAAVEIIGYFGNYESKPNESHRKWAREQIADEMEKKSKDVSGERGKE